MRPSTFITVESGKYGLVYKSNLRKPRACSKGVADDVRRRISARKTVPPLLNKSLLSLLRLQIFLLLRHQDFQHTLVPVEKILGNLVVFRLSVLDLRDAAFGEQINHRVGISQQDGRMRSDDELRLVIDQPVQQRQHAQLPLRRQRCLWLVKQINAVPLQPVQQQREKGLAVRLSMEGLLAVTILHAQFLDLRREVVKAFRAQEETVRRMAGAAFQPQKVAQMRVSRERGEVKVFSSSLSIVTQF